MEITITRGQYKIVLPVKNIRYIETGNSDSWVLVLSDGEKIAVSGETVADLQELLPRISFFEPTSTGWVNVKQLAA